MYRSGYLYDADKHEHVDRRMSVISTRSSQYPIRTLNTFTSVAAQPISHVVSFYTSTKCELEVFDTAKQYHSTFVRPDFEVFFRKYSMVVVKYLFLAIFSLILSWQLMVINRIPKSLFVRRIPCYCSPNITQ